MMTTAVGCRSEPRGRVLILGIEDEKTLSFGMVQLERALVQGGQVTITVEEIRSKYPDFEEKYAISNDAGKYLVQGAVINFVVDRGWNFHSRDFGGLVFVRR